MITFIWMDYVLHVLDMTSKYEMHSAKHENKDAKYLSLMGSTQPNVQEKIIHNFCLF